MSAFCSELFFTTPGGFPYTLTEPLIYQSDLLKYELVVPVGFKTDLASIPRGMWNVLPKSGSYDRAAVVHDFLYQHNGVTRGQADSVLNEAMGVLGVGRWTRWTIYLSVRAGGWKVWGKYRDQELQAV